jgi:redox-sensitive bicupin YhaK (pirin superfamily)
MTIELDKARSVSEVVGSIRQLEGGGFMVRRPFPTNTLLQFDPFMLLDEAGPVTWEPGEAIGAPEHPHRGFETVTYLLSGWMEHKDSHGNHGEMNPGDVQWMTAGSGLAHYELPQAKFLREGGVWHGFQLWVNLPKRDKWIAPRYQEIPSSQIPQAQTSDGKVTVRVIAGEALGVKAVIDTRTPIMYLHYTLQPGGQVSQVVPPDFNIFAYIFSGEGIFSSNSAAAKEGAMVIFAQDGDKLEFAAPAEATTPLEVLLIGGVPLNEPVARYGPFVMNTEAEIYQAIKDYQNGKMGKIDF